ncbi:MAG: glycosyltransferase, partial [Chloroflexota bacterium]
NSMQTMKMAQAFTALGHKVRLFVPGEPSQITWDELCSQYGLQHKFEIKWLSSHPVSRRYDFGWKAVQEAKQFDSDLIFTRLPQSAALASYSGIPTIYEIHDVPTGTMGPFLFKHFIKGKGARCLVTTTRGLANYLAEKLGSPKESPFTIVESGAVDPVRYDDLPSPKYAREQLFFEQKLTIGHTGHLYPGRGADLILRLAAALPGVNFLLVGGEPKDVDRVKQQTKDMNIENVRLTGFIPNAELPLYQAACEILLMPYQAHITTSSGAGGSVFFSPLKMFEYLASGRAIVASDFDILHEVLSAENAVLLPPDDLPAWITALEKLIADKTYRNGLALQAKNTANRYTWAARAERILTNISLD